MALALGMVTPVLHMKPRFDPPEWEVTAGVDDVLWVVQEAEKSDYDWVSCSEHIAIPAGASSVRGGRYFDPFSTLGSLTAARRRARGRLDALRVQDRPAHRAADQAQRARGPGPLRRGSRETAQGDPRPGAAHRPLGDPERTTKFLASYAAIGATGFSLRCVHHSPAHFCVQMAALKSITSSLA